MSTRKIHLELLLLASLFCGTGCRESSDLKTAEALQTPSAETPPPPSAPVALSQAPRADAILSFLSGEDARASINRPVDGGPDQAAVDLVAHDSANNIADRCSFPQNGTRAKMRPPKAILSSRKMQEVEAKHLKVGLIPIQMSPSIIDPLIKKTRVWSVESSAFDFYKILSNGRPDGLKTDAPIAGCIRYSMIGKNARLYSDMIFSVRYDPKTPEILTLAPVRVYYRDFGALSGNSEAAQAAVKVELSLRGFSLERTAGRQSTSVQNQEMAVEIIRNERDGSAVYQRYDPIHGPSIMLPLPPWDYSPTSINPRHNLSILAINVTEIADFGWLQSQVHTYWPSWEYEATDVAKIRLGAEYYGHTHGKDAATEP